MRAITDCRGKLFNKKNYNNIGLVGDFPEPDNSNRSRQEKVLAVDMKEVLKLSHKSLKKYI